MCRRIAAVGSTAGIGKTELTRPPSPGDKRCHSPHTSGKTSKRKASALIHKTVAIDKPEERADSHPSSVAIAARGKFMRVYAVDRLAHKKFVFPKFAQNFGGLSRGIRKLRLLMADNILSKRRNCRVDKSTNGRETIELQTRHAGRALQPLWYARFSPRRLGLCKGVEPASVGSKAVGALRYARRCARRTAFRTHGAAHNSRLHLRSGAMSASQTMRMRTLEVELPARGCLSVSVPYLKRHKIRLTIRLFRPARAE